MKKLICAALCAVLAVTLAFAGCSLKEGGKAETSRDTVVAEVGKEKVTYGELKDLVGLYMEYYAYNGYNITSDEDIESLQDMVLDQLVEERLQVNQAKTMVVPNLTDEEKAEIEKKADEAVKEMEDYYLEQAKEEKAADDTIDVDLRTRELMLEAAKEYYGDDTTYEKYVEFVREDAVESAYVDKLKEQVFKDLSVSDDEIKTEYDSLAQDDKTAYEEDAASYKDAQENYEMTEEGLPPLYAPAGYSRILHIYIDTTETMGEEYTDKLSEMEALKTEYGELAFNLKMGITATVKDDAGDADADTDTTATAEPKETDPEKRMEQIVTEYKALEVETKKMFDEVTADAKKKIDDAYAKLESGSDFKTVMLDVTEDTNFNSYDIIAEKGLLISAEHSGDAWSDEIVSAFKQLKSGQYSKVFSDDDGYHIIYYLADEPSGAVALSTVKEAIKASLLTEKQDAEWDSLLTEWRENGTVKLHEDLIRDIGKA